ncbi:unnamed protein product [Calypogeia fissa]
MDSGRGSNGGSKVKAEAAMSWSPERRAQSGLMSFSGRVLVGLFLFLTFSCTVCAQQPTGFALKTMNNSSMVCNGSSTLTPGNATDLKQAACLAPFPCLQGSDQQSQIAGQCGYNQPIHFSSSRSFSTMFSFNTLKYPTYQEGEGFTFFISPGNPGNVSKVVGGNLGWLIQSAIPYNDHSGNNFAVEFDLVSQTTGGFNDPPGEHVGINVNNLNSSLLYEFNGTVDDLTSLSSIAMLYVWIDYDGEKQWIDVRLSQKDARPCKSLLSGSINLTDVINDSMYLGFSSSTGAEDSSSLFNTQTSIFDWSFSTTGQATNIYGHDERCGLVLSKTAILGVIIGVLSLIVVIMLALILFLHYFRARKVSDLEREKAELVAELKNLDFGARAFTYQELSEATNGFTQTIGKGGFGTVYKGTLSPVKGGETAIAVKKITKTKDSVDDAKQLVAEVKVIGRLRHVNIVPVLGWCYERGQMLLVYKFIEQGDLDQWIFPTDYGIEEKGIFAWGKRMTVLRGVASALKFLHEDFESDETVLHRDIKTRNVMIDSKFNARLGDFGLARFCDRSSHGHQSQQLIGTRGYIAPEYLSLGASQETDVYSFGVLVLVVATGRKPINKSSPEHEDLVRWVRKLYDDGRITDAGDPKVMNYDETFDLHEMERVLKMGLFCCNYEPLQRPLMHDIVTVLQGNSSIFSGSLPPYPYQEASPDLEFPAMDDDDVTIPFDEYSTEHAMLTRIDVD